MDISSLNGAMSLNNVSSDFIKNAISSSNKTDNSDQGFQTIFQSALNMVDETNQLQNTAESAEMQFALGKSTNTHDLQVAQQKANIALQYTVAVRNKVIDAYKEIMNISV
ncbi:MAG: flagellar hook-basal body complex protein FliE [Lachnospiraceae bacterium]